MQCDEEAISAMFERLRDNHFTKWLRDTARRRKRPDWMPAHYVWAIEGTHGHPNIHWLVHVPAEIKREFETKLSRWMARLAGPLNSDQRPILVQATFDATGAALYLLKGTDPRYGRKYRIKTSPQGTVRGKRAGMSKSNGPAARSKSVIVALPSAGEATGSRQNRA